MKVGERSFKGKNPRKGRSAEKDRLSVPSERRVQRMKGNERQQKPATCLFRNRDKKALRSTMRECDFLESKLQS